MGQEGKKNKGSSKGSKMEQLKLKKRTLKRGKVKKETSHMLAPENEHLCSGNGYDLKVIKDKFKKAKRRGKKNAREVNSVENRCDAEAEKVEEISSVDEDCSRGMKKWVLDYRQGRLGLDMAQQRLDEFMAAYEAEQEQARKEREAQGAEEGWTVVVHHKGRKKTTDSESVIAVGSVAQGAIEDKMAKKKQKELALDFYRFQRREAQRNEVMMLQSKFEQDKKRLQQLRAARKFRPY